MLKAIRERLRRWSPQSPVIVKPSGDLDPVQAEHPFVVICGAQFNQNVPSAGTTYREGLCRGFEQLGVPYRLVNAFRLRKETEDLRDPICFISSFDYQYLSTSALRYLRGLKHFVWIGPWFKGEKQFYAANSLEELTDSSSLRRMILESEPQFIFTPVTESGLSFYQEWINRGVRLLSLPLACDAGVYCRPSDSNRFDDVEMAFVGGYWPYKARQFDRYLKPYEDRLTVFGYSRWPYAGYGGQIDVREERVLLKNAKVCPAINEPHAEMMGGDICERVYKVLGSGGMCVTDATAAHRDIFNSDELLVPRNLHEYREMIDAILGGAAFASEYRAKGLAAIQSRHTYAHRAERVLAEFGVSRPEAATSDAPPMRT